MYKIYGFTPSYSSECRVTVKSYMEMYFYYYSILLYCSSFQFVRIYKKYGLKVLCSVFFLTKEFCHAKHLINQFEFNLNS
jgi:hypothetical protein